MANAHTIGPANIIMRGSRVVFSPPFPKCKFRWGTIENLGLMHPSPVPLDCYLVRFPSGMELAVRRERCRLAHPLEALAMEGE